LRNGKGKAQATWVGVWRLDFQWTPGKQASRETRERVGEKMKETYHYRCRRCSTARGGVVMQADEPQMHAMAGSAVVVRAGSRAGRVGSRGPTTGFRGAAERRTPTPAAAARATATAATLHASARTGQSDARRKTDHPQETTTCRLCCVSTGRTGQDRAAGGGGGGQ